MAAMRRGDFARAWRISDTVLARRAAAGERCHDWPRHLQFVWDGRALEGRRVLVRCYHGLGDTLQFARFLPQLRRIAAEVVLWVQPELLDLARGFAGVDRALPLHDGDVGVAYDADLEIMELPHALRITPQDLPGDLPRIATAAATSPAREPEGPCAVGIVWRAGGWDPRRSVPVRELLPLRSLPGIRLFSLQREAADEASMLGAVDVATPGIGDVAARMRRLDLVVTVDTMAAHLAGTLGLPVWCLLHRHCDWRWMDRRTDSPWYPTMRLFRQPKPGDWGLVVRQVARRLGRLSHGTSPTARCSADR